MCLYSHYMQDYILRNKLVLSGGQNSTPALQTSGLCTECFISLNMDKTVKRFFTGVANRTFIHNVMPEKITQLD